MKFNNVYIASLINILTNNHEVDLYSWNETIAGNHLSNKNSSYGTMIQSLYNQKSKNNKFYKLCYKELTLYENTHQVIEALYKRIIVEIWFVQNITILQRKFRKWTYEYGNPGYKRLAKLSEKKYNESNMITKSYYSCSCFCFSKQKHENNNDEELEWSD